MSNDGMMYLLFSDGSLRGISSTPQDGAPCRVPEGATEISRERFAMLAEQARQAISDRRKALRAADSVRQAADYQALSAVNLPDDLARRLSGYAGDAR